MTTRTAFHNVCRFVRSTVHPSVISRDPPMASARLVSTRSNWRLKRWPRIFAGASTVHSWLKDGPLCRTHSTSGRNRPPASNKFMRPSPARTTGRRASRVTRTRPSIRWSSTPTARWKCAAPSTRDASCFRICLLKLFPETSNSYTARRGERNRTGRSEGEISILVSGGLGSTCAENLLTPTDTGSRMRSEVRVEVKIPLLGGRLEKSLAGSMAERIPEIVRFTTEWIAEKA